MLYLYFILFGYSLFRGIRGCFRIITSYRYIKSGSGSISKSKSNIKFHILIPVLREQEIIEDTIKHFAKLKGNYVVYLITTEKETYQKQHCKNLPQKSYLLPTTKEIAEKFIRLNPKIRKKFKIIHYPYRKGVMAHQINFALQKLESDHKKANFIILYNADSRVCKNVLLKYKEIIEKNADCEVIQQSAVFLENYYRLNS